jgi:hypothetical protein
MQIVIDIPEESYVALIEIKCALQRSAGFEKFIVNGIPLPKGHGRLIDADETISNICGSSCGCHLEECGNDNPCYSVTRIKSAKTIIEADKTEVE